MAIKPRLAREAVRTQLSLYADQIPTLREYLPHYGNSELVRIILDRMIILFRESTNRQTPNVTIDVDAMLAEIAEEGEKK